MSGVNYYQLLGLHTTATEGEIRRAYLRLSLQYHPDKRRTQDSTADELFRCIQEAYTTLSCPEKRCLYDFVGSFAALAEVTSSRPIPMSGRQDGRPQHPNTATAAPDQSSAGLWSRSSSGETLHSWGTSSLASASRLSPCLSSDTNLSSSPAGGATALSGFGTGVRICNMTEAAHDGGVPPNVAAADGRTDLRPQTWASANGTSCSGGAAYHPPPPHSHVQMSPSRIHRTQNQQMQQEQGSGRVPPSFPELKLPLPHDPCASSSPLVAPWDSTAGSAHGSPVASPGTLLGKRRTPGGADVEVQLSSHMHRQPPSPQPPQIGLHELVGGSCLSLKDTSSVAAAAAPVIRPGADVHHRLLLTLEEMYNGCVKQLRLARRVFRPAAGDVDELSSSPPGSAAPPHLLLPRTDHSSLPGGGVGADGEQSCLCVEELFRVVVQPGWREGTKVTFPGKGDELPCGSRGDMVLVVAQAAHCRYERRGNDLHTVVVVPLVDALTGGNTAITTLDGRRLVLQLGPACLQPFSEYVVRGEGMPIPPGKAARSARTARAPASGGGSTATAPAAAQPPPGHARGDLHVRFEVAFPQDLTQEQKVELRQALLPQPGLQ